MPSLEKIDLRQLGVSRERHQPLSIWYAQTVLQLPADPPFVPVPTGHATGLQTLEAILKHRDFVNSDCKPAIVLLPELAVPFADIGPARALISAAPKGTIVVFGAGALTEAEALSIENNPLLWEGGSAGRFANCAVVAVGGTNEVYLQPKLLKSAFEKDSLWPGRTVRCFEGEYLRFSSFICSDLLNRPGSSSYMDWLVDELDKREERLTFAIWLQHNEKPRSAQFSNAIEAVGRMQHNTTVLLAGSRHPDQSKRFEHFAVSGAFVKSALFPSQFDKFTHRFHYVEPSANDVSRAVLLRYEVDAYRVRTVLADAIDSADGVEKGELFEESQPYLFGNGVLEPSTENVHLSDLCAPARSEVEATFPELTIPLASVVLALSGLGTQKFLEFLDLGIAPRPVPGQQEHPAGTKHEGGDARCRCWSHRECIDSLTQDDAKPQLAAIIRALAVLESQQCSPRMKYDKRSHTNVELSLDGKKHAAIIVHPRGADHDSLQRKLFGEKAQVRTKPVILVTDSFQRPKIRTVKAGEAPAINALDAGRAEMPRLEPIVLGQLVDEAEQGTLRSFLLERFV